MRQILSHRGLRLVFVANLVSMLGSGMNAAAVIWHMLQLTHSEMSLGRLLVLQTVPALILLPLSGVIIDREDRRHLIMLLDFGRGAVILAVALLALAGRVQLWHLYSMNTLVAAGFWLFWPTINALIQELTPEGDFVGTNTLLLGSVQSGWLIAGSLVGFLYDRIGLGWILMIDFATYAVSFFCYLMVRHGRVIVKPPPAHAGAVSVCDFSVLAGFVPGGPSLRKMGVDRGNAVHPDGRGTRSRRDRTGQRNDGDCSQALHGAGAEYVLFCRHLAAIGTEPFGGSSGASAEPDAGVRHYWHRLRRRLSQRGMAGSCHGRNRS